MKRKRIKLFKLQPIVRQSRKIGRNEPCPCGKTKEVPLAAGEETVLDGRGGLTSPMTFGKGSEREKEVTLTRKVRVKYKHCHGNEQNQAKRKLIADKINQYFYDMTHRKSKKAKLAVIVDKLKEAFNMKHFGRKF